LYAGRNISGPGKWLCKRFRELLVPSLLVGIFTLVVFFATGHKDLSRIGVTLISCLGFQVWCKDSWLFVQLWFLSYILFCYITIPLVQKIPCKNCSNVKFWGVLIGAVIVAQVMIFLLESILHITLLSVGMLLRFYLPYFLLRRYNIHDKCLQKTMYVLSIFGILALVVTCLCRYTSLFPLPDALKELVFIYTQTLVGTICFYWLYQLLSHIQISLSVLKISDMYSYPIYLTHCLFIGYSTSVIRAYNYTIFSVLLALLLTAVSSITIQKLSQFLLRKRTQYTSA
jgi:peptidoglycan/LPS O-acetylase OafA/YrhL